MPEYSLVTQQVAPYPVVLKELVSSLTYRPGWTFTLATIDRGQGSVGLTLDICTLGRNSYHPGDGEIYRVHHYMPVPPAAYDRRSWQRWLFEQILLVERHETCELFQVAGERPYAPNHGPGHDPGPRRRAEHRRGPAHELPGGPSRSQRRNRGHREERRRTRAPRGERVDARAIPIPDGLDEDRG